MATITELERLLRAIQPVLDRLPALYVYVSWDEREELYAAMEPFRWSEQDLAEAKTEAADLSEFLTRD